MSEPAASEQLTETRPDEAGQAARARADIALKSLASATIASWGAGLLAGVTSDQWRPGTWVPLSAVFSVVTPVALHALIRLAGAPTPRTLLAARLSLAGQGLVTFSGALFSLFVPLVEGPLSLPTGDSWRTFALFAGIFLGPAVVALQTSWIPHAVGPRGVRRIIVGGFVAPAALLVLVIAGWRRTSPLPDPDHYLASLAPILTLPPGPRDPVLARDGVLVGRVCETYETRTQSRFESKKITKTDCLPTMQRATDRAPTRIASAEDRSPYGDTTDTVVSASADARYWVFTTPGDRPFAIVDMRTLENQRDHLFPHHVARSLAPPRAWLLAATAGLIAALLALPRAAQRLLRVRRMLVALQGTRPHAEAVTYREATETVTADTLPPEAIETLLQDAAASAALALCVSALFGSPLLASALLGLVL